MEYDTPRNVTNESTAGNGVPCGSVPIVTSCNNRGIVGSAVICWIRPRLYHEDQRDNQESKYRSLKLGGGQAYDRSND
jgi:hypothetical protein